MHIRFGILNTVLSETTVYNLCSLSVDRVRLLGDSIGLHFCWDCSEQNEGCEKEMEKSSQSLDLGFPEDDELQQAGGNTTF